MTSRKEREQALQGWDAASVIRQAQRQIAEATRLGKRMAEVDGPSKDVPLTVDCMLHQVNDRFWKLETLKEPWTGAGIIAVVDQERFTVPEMRMAIMAKLVENRVCGAESARIIASKAAILVHGRVAKDRIVSK